MKSIDLPTITVCDVQKFNLWKQIILACCYLPWGFYRGCQWGGTLRRWSSPGPTWYWALQWVVIPAVRSLDGNWATSSGVPLARGLWQSGSAAWSAVPNRHPRSIYPSHNLLPLVSAPDDTAASFGPAPTSGSVTKQGGLVSFTSTRLIIQAARKSFQFWGFWCGLILMPLRLNNPASRFWGISKHSRKLGEGTLRYRAD